MTNKLIFIYDGECPFCNKFAELLELKSNLPEIQIKDARDKPSELPKDYDIDIKGALLIKENKILTGYEAINFICSQIKAPSDALLEVIKIIFRSKKRSKLLFPILLLARRFTLMVKGVSIKL
ncbi:DCC1-like thiol-disulfide oxidoreductase family protein [Prochlorococcus sp. MIT 1223]|uniref:DCC1-like thiol-disulfide oxidoreductase family protein n=1 Tax=Prochlorococcus sp. MIT 1223 TaxID=3096217 RepID=UPI002A753E4C|nr:DCC1-like thiol-disulfide oxidoreductase family protein [Prochlorococcus sp. MIT 1223]